jgi:hypothetical protein
MPGAAMGKFEPGWKGGPGRPKNSRNKLATAFLNDLAAAWARDGEACIRILIAEDPARFVAICSSLVPREMAVEIDSRQTFEWISWLRESPGVINAIDARGAKALPAPSAEPIAQNRDDANPIRLNQDANTAARKQK